MAGAVLVAAPPLGTALLAPARDVTGADSISRRVEFLGLGIA